jgi:hypothetical protein
MMVACGIRVAILSIAGATAPSIDLKKIDFVFGLERIRNQNHRFQI